MFVPLIDIGKVRLQRKMFLHLFSPSPRMRGMADLRKLAKDAIRAAGGDQVVADIYNPPIRRQAVNGWLKVPPARVPKLAARSGKTPAQIRPDIFGAAAG